MPCVNGQLKVLLEPLWRTFYRARRAHRGTVPAGAEVVCQHDMVSSWLCACIYVGASADTVAIFFRGDGDMVEIHVEANGTRLHICDNHVVDEWDDSPAV